MKVDFYTIGTVHDHELKFAVISAVYENKWVYVRHNERKTWEIPGGHRETGESIISTAERELFEETGAKQFQLTPIGDYVVENIINKQFGRLYYARVIELGELLNSEIAELRLFDDLPENLTYPDIQPHLFRKTLQFLQETTSNEGITHD